MKRGDITDREIDALVSKHVFGDEYDLRIDVQSVVPHRHGHAFGQWVIPPGPYRYNARNEPECPAPFTQDAEAALRVVREMLRRGHYFELCGEPTGGWTCSFGDPLSGEPRVQSDKVLSAVCLAALYALGVTVLP